MSYVSDNKISPLPFDRYLKEGQSQRDRIIEEVMKVLFSMLPERTARQPDFILSNGVKCWVKKFSPPKQDTDGEWTYGFDVKFAEGKALSHLEFSVKCSGWERALTAPIE